MKLRSLLPSDTSGKLSLVLGIALLFVIALFTVGMVAAVLTGNVAQVESSRLINRSYAGLSVCGEAIALVGFVAGVSTILRKRQFSLALGIGLVLNLAGLIVFLPASLALLLTSIFSLLEYLT
jgi:hypothetical protein